MMVKVNLFEHQQKALDQTVNHEQVAYYLDMGLGKTFVGSEKLKQLGSYTNLVVCQKSKVDDWVEHFLEYYGEYFIYDITDEKQLEKFVKYDFKLFNKRIIGVINYDLIFRRPQLKNLDNFTLVLDESSLIQNEKSKRSKFILNELYPKNVVLLSGTPTGGKYEKLWSQCKLLNWNISKDAFWKTYVDYHYDMKDGFPIKIIDGYKNIERLKRKLREHGAIFMKTDEVFDLPEQIDNVMYVPTSKEYKKFRRKSIVRIDNQDFVGDTLFAKRMYERMLCGFANKSKLEAFEDLLDSTDDRLIVFYNFQNELEKLKDILIDRERPFSIVNGEIKDLQAYETFDDSVTLIQYQAGSMGLNLQKSNKIVYFTPTETSELFEQSKKRIHRIGQKRPCFYYRLVCKDSIEEDIYRTLAMRKDYTDYLFVEDSKRR